MADLRSFFLAFRSLHLPPLTKRDQGGFSTEENIKSCEDLILNSQKFESNITKPMLGNEICNYFDSSEATSLLGINAQTLRRPQDGGNDILITGTPAKIPAQVLAYLCFGGRGIFAE